MIADVTGDGKLDLIISSCCGGGLYLYQGNGDGTFVSPVQIGTSGTDPYGGAIGDFDEDGKLDLIFNTGASGETNFYKGKGGGQFDLPVAIPSLNTHSHAAFDAGDFNSDGHLDIIAVTYDKLALEFYPGIGDGTFGPKTTIAKIASAGLGISASPALAEIRFAAGSPERVPESTFQFTWNTGTTAPGIYQVHATLSQGAGPVTENRASFEILPDTRAGAKVVTDKISYNPNETAAITSTISSQSGNYIFENLTAKITISRQDTAGGIQVYTETKTLTTLMPGASFTFKSYWNTAANPKGTYTVTLEVISGGAVLSTSTTSFELSSTTATGAGLAGALTAAPNPVYQGRDETITYTVTNSGNEDIAGLTAILVIADPDTGEAKAAVRSQGVRSQKGRDHHKHTNNNDLKPCPEKLPRRPPGSDSPDDPAKDSNQCDL